MCLFLFFNGLYLYFSSYETCKLEDYGYSYLKILNYGLLILSYVFISVHIHFLNFCVFLLLSFK